MHRGEVLGRRHPRLSDSHSRSSWLGVSAALAGFGGRGALAFPHAVLALKPLRRVGRALLTSTQPSGGAKSQASQKG